MFVPHQTQKKKANETVRLSVPTSLMDKVRCMAEAVNTEPNDVLCQALEYALSDEQSGKKRRPRKLATTDDGKPIVESHEGRPSDTSVARTMLAIRPTKPAKDEQS
jgi:hypothetical protein